MRSRWLIPFLLGTLACSPRPAPQAPADAERHAVPELSPATAAEAGGAPTSSDAGAARWPTLLEVGVGDTHSCALSQPQPELEEA